MEGARRPSPGDQLELSVLEGQPDEQTPLNGATHVVPFSAEQPRPAQEPRPAPADQKSPWSSCNRTLCGKCKLWMAIAFIFLGFIVVIIISLCLIGVTYIDEDENEILELSSNKTFLVMLKIPEECVTEKELPHLLTKRLTDVYSSSPSLNRYFTSVEIMDFREENATITYHLQFGVPSEDDSFMKYMMSEELVLGILLQDFHDQNLSGCETLGLDPESLLLYGSTLLELSNAPYSSVNYIIMLYIHSDSTYKRGHKSEVVEAGLCLKQCSLSCGMKITHSFLQKRYCELTGRI
ncbi:TPA-induced transmembrane protein isoform X1 [Myotis myotis]|uniref:TPA-induced transmembrane protein isoform X1 n=1 Tax=Myotis myotis TaxID=51298 RepID=UPI00174DDDE0|nr:TPA-induced transmembrane protein isoform X1 [Myotis myotis]